MDITSYILGKKAGGGSAPVLQDKEIEITENGETTITADSGYDGLRSVDVTTNVQSGGGKFGFVNGGGIMFEDDTRSDLQPEIDNIVNSMNISTITTFKHFATGCVNITTLDLSKLIIRNPRSGMQAFASCKKLQSLDLSGLFITSDIYCQGMFFNSTALTFLDIRNVEFDKITTAVNYNNMFGVDNTNGVPANCLIVVKDDTQKLWMANHFRRLTNVKTVAEYEGS